jgi:taurine-pyruvate aminotransferase
MSTIKLEYNWIEEDINHMLHGTIPLDKFVEKGCELIIDRAEGARVWDIYGKEYIDALSGLVCVNVGYGRRELAETAKEQILKLNYAPNAAGYTSSAAIEYSSKLSEFLPESLDRTFLCNSGSEANETAYKIARFFWANQGKPNKHKIISRDMGYHGLNLATAWATGIPKLHNKIGPPIPGFVSIAACYCYRCPLEMKYPDCGLACAEALVGTIEKEGPDTVAAFVAEPVYGSSGTIVPPPDYFPKIKDICHEYDVLLILDEIITGFGRTGKSFACRHWDVVPDMMCISKGMISSYLPLSAVALGEKVFKGMVGPDSFPHLYTCGGHPVSCAVAQKNLEIIIKENLVNNSAQMGRYLQEKLRKLENSPHVGGISGLGLLLGIEIVKDKNTREPLSEDEMKTLVRNVKEKGVLVRDCGSILAIAPPLMIDKNDADRIVEALERIIAV